VAYSPQQLIWVVIAKSALSLLQNKYFTFYHYLHAHASRPKPPWPEFLLCATDCGLKQYWWLSTKVFRKNWFGLLNSRKFHPSTRKCNTEREKNATTRMWVDVMYNSRENASHACLPTNQIDCALQCMMSWF
jgi:hypothetical protein